MIRAARAFAMAFANTPLVARWCAPPQGRARFVCSLRLHGSSLSGAQRRVLRSEAGRRLAADALATVELQAPGDEQEDAVWAAQAATRVDTLLTSNELVRVRVRGAGKRARVAALGAKLALAARAEIAQSLGHTVLVYRRGKGKILGKE